MRLLLSYYLKCTNCTHSPRLANVVFLLFY
nr:MAG TPA: hypothetical protein [Caudoviricetes sp.]DAT81001.1 MAG TPA: hypothetical protein [Caudoviricetes sp.]